MSASKLKTLILLILALTVVLLVILVVPSKTAQMRQSLALYEELSQLFASHEIELDPAQLPASQSLYSIELGAGSAQSVAQTLLGDECTLQPDSNSYTSNYRSDNGSFSLTRNGELQAAFHTGTHVTNYAAHAKKTLRAMGFPLYTQQPAVRESAGVYSVRAVQSLLGVPIYADGIVFTYTNNVLKEISGTFFVGSESLTRVSENVCISCADALLVLLSNRDQLGWVGSRIESVEQGYLPTETAASTLRFIPVWEITTDTAVFRVNAMTKEIRQIES